jgi:uncharacterized protein YndB with AHSA1/START domain
MEVNSEMAIDKIKRIIDLPWSPERVWRALTRPEELSRWFSDRVKLDPTVGGEIILEWDAYGRATGVVEAFDPPHTFAFRWRAHGVDPVEPLAPDNSTLVTFTLASTGAGTRLELVETGFAALREPIRKAAYRENVGGWRTELKELVDYVHQS